MKKLVTFVVVMMVAGSVMAGKPKNVRTYPMSCEETLNIFVDSLGSMPRPLTVADVDRKDEGDITLQMMNSLGQELNVYFKPVDEDSCSATLTGWVYAWAGRKAPMTSLSFSRFFRYVDKGIKKSGK